MSEVNFLSAFIKRTDGIKNPELISIDDPEKGENESGLFIGCPGAAATFCRFAPYERAPYKPWTATHRPLSRRQSTEDYRLSHINTS